MSELYSRRNDQTA